MRYLDLAIATLIGTSAIAGIVASSPRQSDNAARALALESQLRDQLLAILQQKGTAWLIQAGPEGVCSYLREASNSSATFSGVIGGYSCQPSPPAGVLLATLPLRLIPFDAVLEAWPNAQA